MTVGKLIKWIQNIPIWYWWWSACSIMIGTALLLEYPYNLYCLVTSLILCLGLIANHVLYSIKEICKNF